MNVKRTFVFVLIGVFMISMMGGVLGADPTAEDIGTAAGEGAIGIVTLIKAFLAVLFDDAAFGEKEMLSRFFFAVLLAMFVYSTLRVFMDDTHALIVWIATGAVTALAIIAIPTDFLEAIRTQYGIMGATILSAIPFAIVTFFTIKSKNYLVSHATWIFYTIYYFALFGQKVYEKLGTGNFWSSAVFSPDVLPYFIAVLAGIFMVVFGAAWTWKWWHSGILDAQMEEAAMATKKRAAALKAEAQRISITGIKQN